MRRRKFIGNISLGTAGIMLGGLPESLNGVNIKKNRVSAFEELETGFINPPDTAKPHTWWNWREGRINPEAITAELEAMKSIGLGGVTMFSVTRFGEMGSEVPCLGPEWHERVKYALSECERLGMSFNFHNCPGWSLSGGPWITPDKNMMHVVTAKYTVNGGETIKLDSRPSWPEQGNTYYRDIAILAFPTPIAYKDASPLPTPLVSSNLENIDLSRLGTNINNTLNITETPSLTVNAGEMAWVKFEFPTLVTCCSLTITGSPGTSPNAKNPDEHRAMVWASDDGINFREIVKLSSYYSIFHRRDASVTHAIPKTTARFFRLVWESPATLELNRIFFLSEPTITSQYSKIGELGRTFISEPVLPTEEGIAITLTSILDLTSQLDEQKNLIWTAPPKETWTVVRIGYQNTGKKNHPAAPDATGLECDKFNPKAVALHFDHYAKEIVKDAVSVNSKKLFAITIDSWEADSQNWSPVFREEFLKRRGYDVLNYLPAFAGFVAGNREMTDRFLCDVRQTMSDLVSETFFGGMNELARKYGLQIHAEDAGGGGETMVSDPVQHYLHVDVPMNEFGNTMKYAASAAHLQNKKVVACEAYTQGKVSWQSCPSSLKAKGDIIFCSGVNHFVFQGSAHNPDIDKIYPGPAFGPYGLFINRGQTWWNMGHAWITYLSRCQFMLQRGKPVADVLYFYGEEPGGPIPIPLENNSNNPDEWAALPKGFDYDLLPPEILIKDLSFQNSQFMTKNGTSYKLLVLRNSDKMSPESAKKIKELVHSGASVIGPRPKLSPSLSNYPLCDKTVEEIGREVWGNCDGETVTRNVYGKGHVFWGITVREVLDVISLTPDFKVESINVNSDSSFIHKQDEDMVNYFNSGLSDYVDFKVDRNLSFIHRQDGEIDIYFISNQSDSVDFKAGFRVTGKKPEIWDPISGSIKDVLSFHQENGRTYLPLHLDSFASVFVIFRTSISINTTGTSMENNSELSQKLVLDGSWKVKFSPGWGAPEYIEFAYLEDWSKRGEKSIKYYSGTAVYSITFNWDEPVSNPVFLDLGRVEVIAEVKLNGRECGIAWTHPYRVNIAENLHVGKNNLEIKVANTWLNRLMGDGKGINMGSEMHTWTTANPFTIDPKYTIPEISQRFLSYYKDIQEPVPSGLLGPVRVLV